MVLGVDVEVPSETDNFFFVDLWLAWGFQSIVQKYPTEFFKSHGFLEALLDFCG